MSELKLISPLLDNFDMGDPISNHNGVSCCPAMEKNSDSKYIVKIISIPASQVQLDALLLTGAYTSVEAAEAYFKDLADQVSDEAAVLQKLSALEGFLPYKQWQTTPMENGTGYLVYLLGEYRRTLEQHFRRKPMTHLGAVNLGLDLCAAMAVCRHSGYLYVDLKPGNICLVDESAYRVFDLGFVKLSGLKYASLPDKYISQYTAPEISDAFSALNTTLDIYAVGLILYQAYNDGNLPFKGTRAPAEVFAPPAYADYEMAEIIMKACAPDPKDRWQDPIQMGQALVSYMQRNGANDVPIIPVTTNEELAQEEITNDENITSVDDVLPEIKAESDPALDNLQESFFDDMDADDETPTAVSDTDEVPESVDLAPVEVPEPSMEISSDHSFHSDTDTSEQRPETEFLVDPELLSLLNDADDPIAPVQQSEEIPLESHEDETVRTEDDFGNLSLLNDAAYDETAPDGTDADIDYTEVSTEVSDILSYADELLAHPIPDPVIPPEPIDVPIPDPLPVTVEEPAAEDQDDFPEAFGDVPDEEIRTPLFKAHRDEENGFPEPTDITNEPDDVFLDEPSPTGKLIKKWLIALLCLFVTAGLAFLGFYYYQHYYLQPISIRTDGTENSLVVYVSSSIDENKLTVYCADTYGNSLPSPVIDGKATFTDLAPGSGYTISVEVTGFYRLTGNTSTAYSTPVQTNVVQFSAISGPEDGSVILSFAIDGPDSQKWLVRYTADGEESKTEEFTGHMVTISGLTIGKEYTFNLESENSVYITGNNQLSWFSGKNIIAEDLEIVGCDNNKLTVSWSSPDDANVEFWTVRCYNDSGFNETIKTAETTTVFDSIDHTQGYTVEVTAANMTVSARTFISENSVTVTGFNADTSDTTKLVLTWDTTHPLADGNWILLYSADGLEPHEVSCSSENRAEILSFIPNANYTFTLLTTTGSYVFNNTFDYYTDEAPKFSNYNVTSEHMEFNMCKTPDVENWDRFDLAPEDYKNVFAVGEKASFLIRVRHEYNPLSDNIVTLFVIRDSSGNIVKSATSEQAWINMWYRGYCELDIPVMPDIAGNYSITVYFNGYYAGEREFSISNS